MTPVAELMRVTPALTRVLDVLEEAGHSAHLVGGAVRNTLMGLPVGDLDIATSAHPDAVAALFEARGVTVHPTGIAHGTLTVVMDEVPFEVTTWRRDVATDGRRATIAFADDIGQDARRRDFTVNALYADRRGCVTDPTGRGLDDISRRRLVFIGHPADRIHEDTLRILRFYRFAATHGMAIDPSSPAASACRALASMLATLPSERVGAELRKILAVPEPAPTLLRMQADGVLDKLLPGMPAAHRITARLLALRMAESRLGVDPDPIPRLCALLPEAPVDRLRLSRVEARRFRTLTEAASGHAGPAELGYRLGAREGRAALAVRCGLCRETAVADTDAAGIDRGADALFPLNGGDLADSLRGPALGAALRDLEGRWIASGFTLGKDDLLAAAQKFG